MKKIIFTLLGLMLVVGFSFGQAKKPHKGKLDRKTYEIEVLPDGKKKATIDELKFVSGSLDSKMMTDDGFKAAPYDASVDSSATPPEISFSCTASDDKEGTYEWTGKVTGDDIEGSGKLTTKKGKTKKSFTFSGTLKGKKQPKQ
jgi:hypothetical protein